MSKRVSRVCKWCGHKVTFDVEKHDKHIYNNALDDFVGKIKSNDRLGYVGCLDKIVDEIAEQLKAGDNNGA